MTTIPKPGRRGPGLRHVSIYLISILGIISLGIFIFSAWLGSLSKNEHEDYRNLIQLRSQVFESTYYMEELLYGNLGRDDKRPLKRLDEATDTLDELIDCATPGRSPFGICVLRSPDSHALLESLDKTLTRIKSVAYKRVMSPEASQSGSINDREFDLALAEFEAISRDLIIRVSKAFQQSELLMERVNWVLASTWAVIIVLSVITLRKREQQGLASAVELRLSEEKYRSLIEATQTAYTVIDPAGRIKDANPEFLALVGNKSLQDVNNLKLSNWTVEPDSLRLIEALAMLSSDNARITNMELTFIRPDRSSVPVELNASLAETPYGPMVFCLLHDETLRKRAQEDILRAQGNLEAVITHSPLPIVGFGRWGEVTLWSPAAELVFGWGKAEVTGRTAPIIHPESLEQFNASMAEVCAGRSVTGFECKGIHRDGSSLMLSYAASPLFDTEGRLTGVIALFEDVTDRKMIEERLMSAVREKDILLQEIHHRVKNNMQIITSMLKLQASNITDPATVSVLNESRNRIRAMALVHDKLYGSKNLSQIDVREYTSLISRNLQQSYGTGDGKIKITIQIDSIFFGVDMAIPYGLTLNELLTNSFKHAFPEGRDGWIKISLSVAPDRSYTLVIEDNGVGLPAGFNVGSGDSFGLKLVRSIVENQLKGSLTAESTDTVTRFTVTFKELTYKKRI